jgi:hypothetical protein
MATTSYCRVYLLTSGAPATEGSCFPIYRDRSFPPSRQ